MNLDLAIWWTGACVLAAGAALAAAAVIAGLSIAAVAIAHYYGRRLWNLQDNLRYMHEWRDAGCPKWHFESGQMTQMRPTMTQMRPTVTSPDAHI